MPVATSDIKFYLSGGGSNADPNAALGGAISATEVVDASLHNLFDAVNGTEATSGDTEYRCIYVKNTHGSLTWLSVAAWISSNTPSTDDTIDIGLGTSAVGGTEQTVANENTAPSGVSFSAPSSFGTGLSIGDLASGQWKAIWVRRTVNASAAAYNADAATLSLQGDSQA